MQKLTLALVVGHIAAALPSAGLAQVKELPRPADRFKRLEREILDPPGLWREAPNFQPVILKNRGHLSSYMAGMCPEVYRDALTGFITRYNPKP